MKINEVIVEAIKFDPYRIGNIDDLVPTDPSDLLKDFRIVNQDPMVVQYGNNPKKRFHLNSRGSWAYMGTEKEVDQTTSALLDQAAGLAGTKNPAKPKSNLPMMSHPTSPSPQVFKPNPARTGE